MSIMDKIYGKKTEATPKAKLKQGRLVKAHKLFAKKNDAKFKDFAWKLEIDAIASKTDKGMLISRIENGSFTHEWDSIGFS